MIPVNTPDLTGNEKKYLNQCIDSGWISSEGPFVREFEEKFAARVQRRHGIAVSNGTVALEAAVRALGIGTGDEVIMPAFTIISCAAAVIRSGGVPVLVDSDPLTWNMRTDELEDKITPRTKAILVVHIYGLPVDMDPVMRCAKKHGLKVIEDAAEMHGQQYREKPCGSFGDLSIFSFYPNKHITTGEGGMMLTNDTKLAEKCRSLRNLCFVPEKRFLHYELGYNFRMTNLQAALGLAQLERLDEFIGRKRAIGARYSERLQVVSEVLQLPLPETAYAKNIYWVYGLVTEDEALTDRLVSGLKAQEIGTRPFFWCMHEQPVLLERGLFRGERYPSAEKLARRGFYVPSGLGLKDEEIDTVASAIISLIKKH